jgi:acyl-CoA synthetase (AMP-forming)/AMP-acid ligase II
MAIQAAGLVATLANPTYTQNEFLHQLRDSSAKLVLAGSDLLPPALRAANEAGVPNDRIYALPGMDGKVKSGAQSYEKLISKTLWEHEPIRGADLDRAACECRKHCLSVRGSLLTGLPHCTDLPYSSGTTGLPKGVNVSHRNVIAMSEMLVVTPDLVKRDTVVMGVLPMCHIFAITMTMHHPLRMGATIVILPK